MAICCCNSFWRFSRQARLRNGRLLCRYFPYLNVDVPLSAGCICGICFNVADYPDLGVCVGPQAYSSCSAPDFAAACDLIHDARGQGLATSMGLIALLLLGNTLCGLYMCTIFSFNSGSSNPSTKTIIWLHSTAVPHAQGRMWLAEDWS